ncbi:MAG: hypothetical protein J6A49_02765 [Clostridia bacterium]|nr:hypothetical protein [Clostridia bacterium]
MAYFVEAEAKLRKDSDQSLYQNNWDKTIAGPTAEALIYFCRQNDDFAKAVVEGGSFKKCIDKIAKGLNRWACSDFAVYKMAAEYYMPGVRVEYTMKIIPPKTESNIIELDLLSLLN